MKEIFEKLVNSIPEYKEFLTVEEMDASSRKLSEDYPDSVYLFEMGRTRENHPLYCLKIGDGSENALFFGCPHPNEPIGAMMLEYLAGELARNKELRDELDYTFYIVKCWDADGTKLNEKWFKGPFNLYNYSRYYFRPAGKQQVEWTFPIDYKKLHFQNVIPETKAMMNLIDEIKPIFIYSLHNAGFGGVYWYMSKETRTIYEDMKQVAIKQGIPLSLGEPEVPYCVTFAPAIYKCLSIRQNYDYLEEYGVSNPEKSINFGTCSADYAEEQCDSFTLLTELPYFYDKRINDLTESDITRREAVTARLDYSQQSDKLINSILGISADYISGSNPYKLALIAFTNNHGDNEATRKMIGNDPKFMKKATVAEKFDNTLITKFENMLNLGLLVGANESELESMNRHNEKNVQKRKALESAFRISEDNLKKLAVELEEKMQYEVVPIKKLITIQLECGLLVANYLMNNRR